jgi:CHAD domain-containing protein
MSDNVMDRGFETIAAPNGARNNHARGRTKPFSGGYVSLQEAGEEALQVYVGRLRKALSQLGHHPYQDYDAETIHDARVAVRGLRAMVKLLEPAPCFERKQLRRYSRGLGGLAVALGSVRDIDVLLNHVKDYVARHDTAEGMLLHSLRQELLHQRKIAAKKVKVVLSRKGMHRLLDDLQHDFGQRSKRVPLAKDEESGQLLVRHFAGSAIWQRYQEILRYETLLGDASGETLHALRIACKRLRYSMQIFGQTTAALEEILAALKAAQDHLGRLHDILFAEQLVRGLLPRTTSSLDGTRVGHKDDASYTAYLDALQSEGAQLRLSIGPIWESLTGLKMRQKIAGFIASL